MHATPSPNTGHLPQGLLAFPYKLTNQTSNLLANLKASGEIGCNSFSIMNDGPTNSSLGFGQNFTGVDDPFWVDLTSTGSSFVVPIDSIRHGSDVEDTSGKNIRFQTYVPGLIITSSIYTLFKAKITADPACTSSGFGTIDCTTCPDLSTIDPIEFQMTD